MQTIYVDVDGTLLDKSLDQMFVDSGCNVDWYRQQYVDSLAVHVGVVRMLRCLKSRGHRLVLWTNRGIDMQPMTQANLGDLWHMFDEHQFHEGKKLGTNLDGITLDNEQKYVTYAGSLVQW